MDPEQVVQQEPVAPPVVDESTVVAPVETAVAAPPIEEEDPEVTEIVTELGLDPEKKGRISKRVKQLLGRAKTAEEKAHEEAEEKARWRDEVFRRDAIATPAAPQEIQIDTSDIPVPTREAFDHDEDKYQAAVAERAAVIAYRRERARERQQDTAQQDKQAKATNLAWEQEGRKKFADFDGVLLIPAAGGPVITDPMAFAIRGNERGHEVAYWLSKNIQESHRIASLHPVEQSIEIGKIAKRLATTQPKTITSAPGPTMPMGDRETVTKTVDLYDQKISFADYKKIRMDQMRQKAAGG